MCWGVQPGTATGICGDPGEKTHPQGPAGGLFGALGPLQLMWGDRGAPGAAPIPGQCRGHLQAAGLCCRWELQKCSLLERIPPTHGYKCCLQHQAAQACRNVFRPSCWRLSAAWAPPKSTRVDFLGCGSALLAVAVLGPPAALHGMQVSELWSHHFRALQPSFWLWTSCFHKKIHCLVADGLMPSAGGMSLADGVGRWSQGAAILAADLGQHHGQGRLSTCWARLSQVGSVVTGVIQPLVRGRVK